MELGEERVCKFRAYIASALTGLSLEERARTDRIKARIASACETNEIHPYLPERKTSPQDFPQVPAREVWATDRREALNSDLLILLADGPSTGAGIEFEFARSTLMPVLVVAAEKSSITKMVLGAPAVKEIVRYSNEGEVEEAVSRGLSALWPQIVDRQKLVTKDRANHLGYRIRQIREEHGLSESEFAERLGTNEEDIEFIETAPDGSLNLSVPGLRLICSVLQVPLELLVQIDEPDGSGVFGGEGVIPSMVSARSHAPNPGTDRRRLTVRDRTTIETWLSKRKSRGSLDDTS